MSEGWRKANDRTDPHTSVSGVTWPSAAPAPGGCGQQCPSPGPCGRPLWVPGPLKERFLAPHLGGEQGQFCPPGPETLCSASTLQLFLSSKRSFERRLLHVKIFSCIWDSVTTVTPLRINRNVLKPGVTVYLGAVQVPACFPPRVRDRTTQDGSGTEPQGPSRASVLACLLSLWCRPSVHPSALPPTCPQRLVCLALVLSALDTACYHRM